ncbi:MAG: hypothetical protein ABIA08_00165 [bacterium]
MNNKTIIYITVIIVVILVVTGYFLWNNQKSPAEEINQEEGTGQENQEEKTEPEEIELIVFAKDEFEMKTPSAWQELTPPEGIKVMLTYLSEEQIDPEKEKSGFRTYLAITFDDREGKSSEEFIQYVKEILTDALPFIEFTKEESVIINGRTANVIEALVSQEGYNFKTLLVIINGEGEDVWTLSFNTSEVRWEDSKDLFYQIANSFKLK